jgi:CubicO group peptidase (beta-lactamase class C family)
MLYQPRSEHAVEGPTVHLAGLRGTALVRRSGADDLRIAGGTTGGRPDAVIQPETRFQIASISKQFTAAATLLLVDRDVVSLDDHLVDILDGCPVQWKGITIHQLLCHTSGLIHWPQLPNLDLTGGVSVDELLVIFGDEPLLGEPGERYAYSSPGYVLLAHVVQRASGTPYRTFLADEVFGPLAMDATFAGNAGGELNVATPLHHGEPVRSFELDVVGMGAGDVWSTVDDLAHWDDMIESRLVLSDESRKRMLTPHATVDDEVPGVKIEGYGYGWYLADIAGHRVNFHTGGNAGFQSINAVLPDDGATLVALTNDTSADLYALALELFVIAIGGGS